jgi:hypothetical protein
MSKITGTRYILTCNDSHSGKLADLEEALHLLHTPGL